MLLRARIEDVDGRIADLRQVRKVLRALLARCRASEDGGRCEAIEDLGASVRRS